uniref:Uncharacterized protein n=1 Tax=Kwoniella pini CBS 10737 TaxID=1296096 RepID=A0A1B9I9Y0_9TREE|nr:uncharacterized protein I206_01684 [Kwoniella pini CBS 10737]OCF52395.1 hypothetical protein I206_01684 [Kwoniella pini CBS 10737]
MSEISTSGSATSADLTSSDKTNRYPDSIKNLFTRAEKCHELICRAAMAKEDRNYDLELETKNSKDIIIKLDPNGKEEEMINKLTDGNRRLRRHMSKFSKKSRLEYLTRSKNEHMTWLKWCDWDKSKKIRQSVSDSKGVTTIPDEVSTLLQQLPKDMIYGRKLYDDITNSLMSTLPEPTETFLKKYEVPLSEIEHELRNRGLDV